MVRQQCCQGICNSLLWFCRFDLDDNKNTFRISRVRIFFVKHSFCANRWNRNISIVFKTTALPLWEYLSLQRSVSLVYLYTTFYYILIIIYNIPYKPMYWSKPKHHVISHPVSHPVSLTRSATPRHISHHVTYHETWWPNWNIRKGPHERAGK